VNRLRTTLALAAGMLPLATMAHTHAATHDHGIASGLLTGFIHPFTGPDHLAAMVAVGIWSAMTASRVWLAPAAFAGTLLAGAVLGMAGLALPAVEPMIAVSLLVLGLLIATRQRLPATAAVMLTGGFALFHGAAHGTELAGPYAVATLIGIVTATALLHATGLCIGPAWRGANRWPARLAGAGVALFGLSLLS